MVDIDEILAAAIRTAWLQVNGPEFGRLIILKSPGMFARLSNAQLCANRKTSCPIRRCAMTASNLDGQNGIMGSTPPQASQGTCAQVSKHFCPMKHTADWCQQLNRPPVS